ncbi:7TM diverse intracellular signaling domain-containing protein [Aureisphaera galaxeae]|uniref:7TM diverse intracellular signaling domain-containing protein n=1 Tax=Aureisphaera galaxeae TaxID=1538023 RepID=UPI002350F467|nr:7TM diverse intracellular signaling domain-containing protein [Aureisphaera galaxeae]MDC8003825.1 7TM diverse intracellular signaling domain-containing protein [Aureisphaera galaxeae]
MRSVLLLIFLSFCTLTFAKKKEYTTKNKSEVANTESAGNTMLKSNMGSEFAGLNAPLINQNILTPEHGFYHYENPFAPSDHFLGYSEFSYKNESVGGGSSTNFNKTDTSEIATASIGEHTLFSQGMYYGFTIMLVLLNLVCFFLFEEKTYLFYAAALGTMSVLLFYSDGLFAILGMETAPSVSNLQTILLFLATVCGALFADKYLSLREFAPKLKFYTLGLLAVAGLLMAFSWTTGNEVFNQTANTVLFGIMGVYFLAGVYLFSKKNYAKFFVIASFIPLLFSIDYFVLAPLGIDFLATQTTHIKAAAIAEMLILTYAIMYRMQSIKEEHELRQAEMRIFLKRQEALSTRRKTEKIVEDVYLENLIMHYDLDGLEIKLLQYISEGKTNAKIARKLKTTENDVEELTKELYEKLEISEQIQQDYRMVDAQPDYIYN